MRMYPIYHYNRDRRYIVKPCVKISCIGNNRSIMDICTFPFPQLYHPVVPVGARVIVAVVEVVVVLRRLVQAPHTPQPKRRTTKQRMILRSMIHPPHRRLLLPRRYKLYNCPPRNYGKIPYRKIYTV
jgi:hypothetical protein